MSERKYSVSEIDQMRRSLDRASMQLNESYNPIERTAEIEQRLRTHMQSGTDPGDLKKAADAHMQDLFEQQEQMRKLYDEQHAKPKPPA